MYSSLIGKIEKAKRYSEETNRITFHDFSVTFHGEHGNHLTSMKDGRWFCTCDFFSQWGRCSHTMAMQRILGDMMPSETPKEQMELIPGE